MRVNDDLLLDDLILCYTSSSSRSLYFYHKVCFPLPELASFTAFRSVVPLANCFALLEPSSLHRASCLKLACRGEMFKIQQGIR